MGLVVRPDHRAAMTQLAVTSMVWRSRSVGCPARCRMRRTSSGYASGRENGNGYEPDGAS
jgi:hypothetical protein